MNAIICDPPYGMGTSAWRGYAAVWAEAIGRASALLNPDTVRAYAKRVGRETIKSVTAATNDAASLAAMGFVDHVEATAACERIPIEARIVLNLDPLYTVGGDAARAFAASKVSAELRTPPSEWTTAPPLQLFDP